MGKIGEMLGGAFGGAVGKKYGGKTGGKIGKSLGKIAGSLVPFKRGGMVKKTGPILAHKNELIVPASMVKHVSKTLKKRIRANQKK
jgi:hypothetical protein